MLTNIRFETGDGVSRREEGFLKNVEGKKPIQVQQGTYSYTGTDGKVLKNKSLGLLYTWDVHRMIIRNSSNVQQKINKSF